jgi:capsular polysaccharide export protein
MLDGADAAVLEPESELSLLAGLTGVAVQVTPEQAELRSSVSSVAAPSNLTTAICDYTYWNPFTGEPMSLLEAVELLGFWKRLIDGNRDIASALGFAFWKQPTVAPLLWGGVGPVPFHARPRPVPAGKSIAIWKSRVAPRALVEIEKYGAQLVEVEDGFIRSTGLGADCVPPLSIVVDRLGVHFDPSAPSELEELLEKGMFAPELLTRARALRKIIVDLSVSKYESGRAQAQSRRSARRHILVPGQVEDDRAVLSAKEVIVNAELLRRVRRDAPDAYIIYKPHPDVEAGHRLGGIPDDLLSQLADEVVRDKGITSWIEMVDEVHVNTSLAGFEALLRGKAVTTHGMPFYAGWGLTRDLAEVPQRRTASRSLDELVAAVLLLYPRYVDPVTGLPCPPEILIRRLSEGSGPAPNGAIVQMRRLQGRFKRRVAAMRFW